MGRSYRGIRPRITVLAIGAVIVVLVVASAVLVVVQRKILTDGIDTALQREAGEIVDWAQAGVLSVDLPPIRSEGFAVVVDDGRLVAATPGATTALDIARVIGEEPGYRTVDGLPVDDDRFRVLTRLEDFGVVYVGSTFDIVDEASAALISLLGAVVPLVAFTLGVIVWRLIGRTLGPVEDIRTRVADIGASDLGRRIPEPGTGDEIDRLAATMNHMLDRLETAVARQSRFVDDASHELRTPVARLRAAVEIDSGGAGFESLREDVIQLSEMVEDLLFLARLHDGRQTESAPVDLEDVVIGEVDLLRPWTSIALELRDVDTVTVSGNRSDLARLVRNILENATRAAESRVWVSVEAVDDDGRVTVEDDGPGVDTRAAAVIFDRFGRVDDARSRPAGGSGLGLAIAREIATAHHGRVELCNPGERGARFAVTIPAI
ncbi:MAG: HAMP domain-containing histidine kinase [Acidimicrobiia bacterium]|nr:HAMP domain-containing histidine kinase [Acidimicrobiia bacterium]MDH4308430.1 HAMP domain-containing histidine kinase [Acidimicrobiia bacterium]MDH5292199.1 HAMP domain-containing histidine kinase [Acidimicrobiia bacterium]